VAGDPVSAGEGGRGQRFFVPINGYPEDGQWRKL